MSGHTIPIVLNFEEEDRLYFRFEGSDNISLTGRISERVVRQGTQAILRSVRRRILRYLNRRPRYALRRHIDLWTDYVRSGEAWTEFQNPWDENYYDDDEDDED